MATFRDIVIDCGRAAPLARFWADALDGYAVRPYDEAEIRRLAARGLSPDTDPTVALDGPGPTLWFREVDAPKTGENRLHLDLYTDTRKAEVGRLRALGGTVKLEREALTVMQDPEGNEFCVIDRGPP